MIAWLKRLSSIAAFSIGLNAAAIEDAAGRGRAADGRVRLEICEDVGAIVGSGEGGARLAFNPYPPAVEMNSRCQVVDSRRRKDDRISVGHRR